MHVATSSDKWGTLRSDFLKAPGDLHHFKICTIKGVVGRRTDDVTNENNRSCLQNSRLSIEK
jgi:hypothetical protein